MEISAYAKINWNLKILGKRPDGFHEIDTTMVSIGLADHLTIQQADELSMTCDDPSLPTDDGNLVIRAAIALASAANIAPKANIHVAKNIPAGGGLGGGSSDAASTLVGLNQLWNLDWPKEKLAEIAGQLGSDIPFFLWGGWGRCTGRGEIIKSLPEVAQKGEIPITLLLPPIHIGTPAVYKALQAPSLSTSQPRASLTSLTQELNIEIVNLMRGNSLRHWPSNDLMSAAEEVAPELLTLHRFLNEEYPGRWQMSGSGAVHYLVLTEAEQAEDGLEKRLLEKTPCKFKLVKTATLSPTKMV